MHPQCPPISNPIAAVKTDSEHEKISIFAAAGANARQETLKTRRLPGSAHYGQPLPAVVGLNFEGPEGYDNVDALLLTAENEDGTKK